MASHQDKDIDMSNTSSCNEALADVIASQQELQEITQFVPEDQKDSFIAHEERADYLVGKMTIVLRERNMPRSEETKAMFDKELEDHERAWKAKWDAIKEEHRKEKAEKKPCPHADGH